MGKVSGEDAHQIAPAELPSVRPQILVDSGGGAQIGLNYGTTADGQNWVVYLSKELGQNVAHENRQRSLHLNYLIKV